MNVVPPLVDIIKTRKCEVYDMWYPVSQLLACRLFDKYFYNFLNVARLAVSVWPAFSIFATFWKSLPDRDRDFVVGEKCGRDGQFSLLREALHWAFFKYWKKSRSSCRAQ